MTQPLVHYVALPGGDGAAVETLALMQALVTRALVDPQAVGLARVMLPVDLAQLGPDERIAAVRELLGTRFQFAYDPAPMDRVADPVFLLHEMNVKGIVRGDCDDAAVLAAYLGSVAGVPYRFRAIGFRAHGPLSHVYTLLRGEREWHSLDVTRNSKQVVPAARRVLEYP